jgi:hypothetical protein
MLPSFFRRAALPKISALSTTPEAPAKAEEIPMSTAPASPNGFVRFIDAIGHFFVKAEPVALEVAQEAEPLLAFTPIGPEYTLAVEAIAGAQKAAAASIAAGVNLTNTQKAQLAIQAATPGLNAILTSKGVTADQETHVSNWIQTVFNILAGPVANIIKSVGAAKA